MEKRDYYQVLEIGRKMPTMQRLGKLIIGGIDFGSIFRDRPGGGILG